MTVSNGNPSVHPTGGPYVQLAAFCERVMIETDGVQSLIRVVDRIFINMNLVPVGAMPSPHSLIAVVALKADQARGTHTLTIRPEGPSVLRMGEIHLDVLLEGEERGVFVQVPVAVATDQPGLFWFDVLVDGTLLTRMPIRVVHQRQTVATTAEPG